MILRLARRYPIGEYINLHWGDFDCQAHYVAGHVSPAEFRAELARWLGGKAPTISDDTEIKHGYARYARGENDEYGNRQLVFLHSSGRTGRPITYWEVP